MKLLTSALVAFFIIFTNLYAHDFIDLKKGNISTSKLELESVENCEAIGSEGGWVETNGELVCSRSGDPGYECIFKYKMTYSVMINDYVLTIEEDEIGSFEGKIFTQKQCQKNVRKIYYAKALSWLSSLNKINVGTVSGDGKSQMCSRKKCKLTGMEILVDEDTRIIKDYNLYEYMTRCENNN